MSVEANYILRGIAVGIGGNVVMDLWNLFLKRTLGIPSLSYVYSDAGFATCRGHISPCEYHRRATETL